MGNGSFRIDDSDIVMRCVGERGSGYDVVLASSGLWFERKLFERLFGKPAHRGTWNPRSVVVEVIRDRSIGLGIPFALRVCKDEDECECFVFLPENPAAWLTAMEKLGAKVNDRYDIRNHPVRVWLCNHIEFLPMLLMLPLIATLILLRVLRLLSG